MLSPERQSTRISKIKIVGLDQYGAERFEQQQFGTAGVEGVKMIVEVPFCPNVCLLWCKFQLDFVAGVS